MRERSTLAISLVLLGALAAGSYWLAEQARLSDASAKGKRHEPDYWIERFGLTRMDEEGHGRYTISSARLVHYPDDDSTTLAQPRLVSLTPDKPRVNMRANEARISSDGERVDLIGDVEIRRAATGDSAEIVMRSPALLVLPEQDIARTDQPVEMIQGATRVAGRGLDFDNGKRYLQLNPNNIPGVRVNATFAPRASVRNPAPAAAAAPAAPARSSAAARSAASSKSSAARASAARASSR